jgi:hypothetical protein
VSSKGVLGLGGREKRGMKIVYDNKTFLFSLENVVGWFLVEMFSGGWDGEGGEGFEKYGPNI